MSFLTCFWLFPQKEHFSRSAPSPMRATCEVLPVGTSAFKVRRKRGSRGQVKAVECLAAREHVIDQAVFDGLLRREDVVASDVQTDLLRRAAGCLGHHHLEQVTHAKDLASLRLDV